MRHLWKAGLLVVLVAAVSGLPGRAPAEPADAAPAADAGARTEGPLRFDDWFRDGALRVDLYHTGGLGSESFSLDGVVREPLWPGRRADLVDPTGFGQYRFRVRDARSHREIFSQGFASLMGEWVTTDEAGQLRRTMHESVRFPMPRAPVTVAVERRNREGELEEVYSVEVDPASRAVDWGVPAGFPVLDLAVAGPPEDVLDVLILAEGYRADEVDKLRADARRFADILFEYEPYRSRRERISIRAVEVASRESGVDEPRKGVFRDTALGCSFNTFDSARYLTTEDNLAMREIASLAPYDTILIMVSSSRYGGGGIYNLYAVFTADSEYAEYVMIHELGHSFGALGDEYHDPSSTSYDDELFYPSGVEPWEPNLTALLDPSRPRWGDLIRAGTPVPTPATEEYRDVVGVFEGAGYRAHGLYRPCFDSIMFHKGHLDYCPVSERAIAGLVDWNAGRGWPR